MAKETMEQAAMRELSAEFAEMNRRNLQQFIDAGLTTEEAEDLLDAVLADTFRGLREGPSGAAANRRRR